MTVYELEPRFKMGNAIAFGSKLGSKVEGFPSVKAFTARHLVGYDISTAGVSRYYENHGLWAITISPNDVVLHSCTYPNCYNKIRSGYVHLRKDRINEHPDLRKVLKWNPTRITPSR